MKKNLQRFLNKEVRKIKVWSEGRIVGLFIFNALLVLLVLLHSAGYFAPFFPLTINTIVMVSLISSIFLLGTNSKAAFTLTLLFWLFAAFLKIVKIDVWAERTVIYSYEALIVGVFLFIMENTSLIKRRNGESVDS